MSGLSELGLITAFAGGVISFLSPCVLALVPGYLSFVANQSARRLDGSPQARDRWAMLGLSTLFVLGFSSVFVLLGASATALGRVFLAYRNEVNLVSGSVIALFGLFMTGLFRPSWLARDWRIHAKLTGGHPIGAYFLGLAFGFGWTPCIGPVLGAILTMSVFTADAGKGIVLLGTYALGLGVPFLLSALCTGSLVQKLKPLRRIGRALYVTSGVVMIAVGLAIVTGWLPRLSYWLIDTFPVLVQIG